MTRSFASSASRLFWMDAKRPRSYPSILTMRAPCNISVTSSKRKFRAERKSLLAFAKRPKIILLSKVLMKITPNAADAAGPTSQKSAPSVMASCNKGPQIQWKYATAVNTFCTSADMRPTTSPTRPPPRLPPPAGALLAAAMSTRLALPYTRTMSAPRHRVDTRRWRNICNASAHALSTGPPNNRPTAVQPRASSRPKRRRITYIARGCR
mmetsp:Transcript_14256/g.42518  ORF Transcript_14256/g.42518 Transcript_14256/m.42518 type:complete len:210 (+) Transcript_14256:1016-1645(+)